MGFQFLVSNQGKHRLRWRGGLLLTAASLCALSAIPASSWAQRVRVNRYLSLQNVSGNVALQTGNSSRTAEVGDRLQSVGDGLSTGQTSVARLVVDTGIGFVDVSENTRMQIRRMDVAPDNGRITHFDVPQGQIRLEVRTFTHEGSELEIHTPAGVSSVRGTEFGVVVQPDGKMGVATLEGAVDTTAQDATVNVPEGFQNLTIPGEPPSPAVPLRDDPTLDFEIRRIIEGGNRRLQFVGRVDPVNLVLVEEESQTTDEDGTFTRDFLPIRGTQLQVTVITPLGTRQDYDVEIF
ncbi:MAG: FecR domain-containing protein [Cyanobacteria bacterium J06639_14]